MFRYIAILFVATAAWAEPFEPLRGSTVRTEILQTIRFAAEKDLGAPVEFVVDDLRVDGKIAFAALSAQRPGGGDIDLSQAPFVLRGDRSLDTIDGPTVVAYLIWESEGWQISDYIVGPADVWWIGYDCTRFAPLQPAAACK